MSSFAFYSMNSASENLRIACAGCIAHTLVEGGFHMIDTVNIRTKANSHLGTSSMTSLIHKIWAKEGVLGFGRGFSAAFYGAVYTGFSYFYLYKTFKTIFSDLF